ncbi:MAG: WD40 repeat domain-containing protein [Methanosarcinales archaeon]
MFLFGLLKSKAHKQAELDIANARLKLQSVDSGIKVSDAGDLLAQAENELKNKNWKYASSLANKCVVNVNDILADYKRTKESINSAKSSLQNLNYFGTKIDLLKQAEYAFDSGDYAKADKLAKEVIQFAIQYAEQLNRYSKIWEFQTGSYRIRSVAVTPDGSRVIAGSRDKKVYAFDAKGDKIWDYPTGNVVFDVAVTPDGDKVIAGSAYQRVYVFDANGNKLWEYQTRGRVNSVAVTQDGSIVIAGSNDNKVYVFENIMLFAYKNISKARLKIQEVKQIGIDVLKAEFEFCEYKDAKIFATQSLQSAEETIKLYKYAKESFALVKSNLQDKPATNAKKLYNDAVDS